MFRISDIVGITVAMYSIDAIPEPMIVMLVDLYATYAPTSAMPPQAQQANRHIPFPKKNCHKLDVNNDGRR